MSIMVRSPGDLLSSAAQVIAESFLPQEQTSSAASSAGGPARGQRSGPSSLPEAMLPEAMVALDVAVYTSRAQTQVMRARDQMLGALMDVLA